MKTIIITIFVSYVILTSLQGQWEIENEGFGQNYFDEMDFIDKAL